MDAPVRELHRMDELHRQGRELLATGRPQEAAAAAEEALALESDNVRSLTLQADAWEALGQREDAEALRLRIRLLRREAWQREVEAEIRGHHDLLGEAIRHEQL